MPREIIIDLFPKQAEFAKAVFSGRYRYLLYGGAIRGGKTVVVLAVVFVLCRVFPGSRWVIVRKDLPTIRRNLLPTFNRFKPDFVGDVNFSTWTARCANGSEILFMPESFKDDPEGHRFRGLEANGFVLEEATELREETFVRCQERMGTLVLPGLKHRPPALILLTCNPAPGWVKERFYLPWKAGTLREPYFFLPATADDNPHVPAELRAQWKDLPEREYRRYVLGDWEVSDEPDQLIRFEWIHQAYEVEPEGGRRRLGIDVARYGDDETVFAYMEGNRLVDLEAFRHQDLERIAEIAALRMSERSIRADMVAVDAVGLGAGVVDALRARGFEVKEVQSGARPLEEDSALRFKNLRAQMWWHLRTLLENGRLRIEVRHPKLVEDLLSVRYRISGDRTVEVESKDQIKRRTGRSTDYGDALVYAAFADRLKQPSRETEILIL